MPKNQATDVFKHIEMRGMDACWPWIGTWGGRVRDLRPYFTYGGRRTMAYRIVYELVHGVQLDRKQLLLHACDNGSHPIGCCNPHHMRIGTERENARDMMDRERFGLSVVAVTRIRAMLASGRTQQEIADLHGVSRETVSAIATGRTYKQQENRCVDGEQG